MRDRNLGAGLRGSAGDVLPLVLGGGYIHTGSPGYPFTAGVPKHMEVTP